MQDLYLVHHGVQGQQWGKKNGPPYPLDSAISTGKKLIEKHKQNAINRAKAKVLLYKDKKGFVDRKTREFSFKRDRINATTGLDVKIPAGIAGAAVTGLVAAAGAPVSVIVGSAIGAVANVGIIEIERRLGNKYYDMKIDRYKTAYNAVKDKTISEIKSDKNKNSRKVVDAKTVEELSAKSSLVFDRPIKIPSQKSNAKNKK